MQSIPVGILFYAAKTAIDERPPLIVAVRHLDAGVTRNAGDNLISLRANSRAVKVMLMLSEPEELVLLRRKIHMLLIAGLLSCLRVCREFEHQLE